MIMAGNPLFVALRDLAWRAELKALDAKIESEPLPVLAGSRLVTPSSPWAPRFLVWRLPVPGKADVFMSIKSGEVDDNIFVVPVHAAAFHRLWLSQDFCWSGQSNGCCLLRSELTNDYKYHRAVEGFARGEENPVPLADVYFQKGLSFMNGITRTFWLLANNVAAFPVKMHGQEEAAALAMNVGLQSGPMCLADMFRNAEQLEKLNELSNATVIRP